MNFKKLRALAFILIYLGIQFIGARVLPDYIVEKRLFKIGVEYTLALLIFFLLFKRVTFPLSLRINRKIDNLKFIIPVLVVLCIYSTYSSGLLTDNVELSHPFYFVILIALIQTLVEELIFRGLLINDLKTQFKIQTHAAVIISSVLFGLLHLLNFTKDVELDGLINQAIIAAGLGYFLAALFITSKSILIPSFAHFLINLPAYLKRIGGNEETNVSIDHQASIIDMLVSSIMVLLIYSPLFIIGFLLLRKFADKKE